MRLHELMANHERHLKDRARDNLLQTYLKLLGLDWFDVYYGRGKVLKDEDGE